MNHHKIQYRGSTHIQFLEIDVISQAKMLIEMLREIEKKTDPAPAEKNSFAPSVSPADRLIGDFNGYRKRWEADEAIWGATTSPSPPLSRRSTPSLPSRALKGGEGLFPGKIGFRICPSRARAA
jgi:hypothetical protein